MNSLTPGKDNQEERNNFIKYWAEFVRTHPDKEWSTQQKILIESQLKSANISAKEYLRQKGELKD
tara:strand:+ start:346 stop:540 length:195 start_codon:yes stop_codon:yes gene_type:complete